MATYGVEIGHDVRRWTTYSVTDPTDEELATLREGADEAVDLLQRMEAAGRAEGAGWTDEENPDPFDWDLDPAVVSVEG